MKLRFRNGGRDISSFVTQLLFVKMRGVSFLTANLQKWDPRPLVFCMHWISGVNAHVSASDKLLAGN